MSAEQLIGLEAAQAELGTLYAVARSFTALHARAETELLPYLVGLGRRLRGLLRQARPAARFSATPTSVCRGAPALGEHTDEILAELWQGAAV